MTDRLIIALAQLNPTLGAISANLDRAREARREAADADLILFPELFICGYPPEDLVLRTSFVEACRAAVEELAKETVTGPAVLIGLPWREGANLYNSVALLANGKIEAVRHKFDLPNYGVFDEKRVFRTRPHLLQGRETWRSHLRGHLDGRDLRDAGRDGSGNPALAQWLALRAEQG